MYPISIHLTSIYLDALAKHNPSLDSDYLQLPDLCSNAVEQAKQRIDEWQDSELNKADMELSLAHGLSTMIHMTIKGEESYTIGQAVDKFERSILRMQKNAEN
ncbi:hypothetical protein [Parashewanella tropica]|uniref:hypothetical protein n=1 Tax=Parashewanella tropica TaxID=2547970 RepID=UPI00105A5FF1|nr:hypothetical protein [Parashewanella tropica]